MIAISNLTNGRFPTDSLIYFERGAMNPIQTIFANANVKGCFLCLCSNVWKHVHNVRLHVRYFEEPEFTLQLPNVDCPSISPN